jgi:flavin reductase (DIM6/NTAB) family NADH-FMN oxidoreductase RutF
MDERWSEALGHMVHGTYVLTTSHHGEINGMIASWVCQVSYEPPLVMVAVHPNRFSHHLIEKSRIFALHLISRERNDLLKVFKGPDPAGKFASVSWSTGKTGAPLLEGCLGYVECEVKAFLNPGNHTLFIDEVVGGRLFSHESPMSTLEYEGAYTGER